MAATGHEGETVLKVYFLDNSSKMLMVNYDVTAEEVCDMIAMRLGFKEPELASSYFSLFESVDGNIPRRALGRTECVKDVQQGCAKIIYMMKLFMPTALKMVESDPIMLHLQYIQALHSVITGTHFHNSIAICVKLAALDFHLKYGPHNPKLHKIGFLTHRLYEFIPAHQLSLKEPLEWEEDIYAEHQLLLQRDELNPKLEYVKICQSWDCNGCILFEVRQTCLRNHPPKVLVGINTNGVWVLHIKTRETLELYKISEVYRWGFKPGSNFYFEIKGTGGSAKGPIFEFGTTQGNRISELLTDYANALLDELGLSQKNTETASAVLDGMINSEDAALAEKKKEIGQGLYLGRGVYIKHLKNWLERFRREQLMICTTEAMEKDPAEIFRETVSFLGLPSADLQESRKLNAVPYPPMDPATRMMLQEYYQKHNEQLGQLLNHGLDWS